MAYSNTELASEFWMLTKGILQDSSVDVDEARVIKRWLEEHCSGPVSDRVRSRLDKFLADGYIDRFESQELVNALGSILRMLRTAGA